jgi:hypothetical protein
VSDPAAIRGASSACRNIVPRLNHGFVIVSMP